MTQLGLGVAALVLTAGTAFAGQVTTPIPEPASMALLAVGAGALAVYRLRRRK